MMFSYKIDENIELRLLEERHAEEVFALLQQNQIHLQAELTWLTDQLELNDAKEYIKAGLGYWVGAAFQGQGLVTKACRILIKHSFSKLKLNRLEIQCDSENDRSRKVAERLGFSQEGILRQSWWSRDRFVNL